jgi:hypothetical protein
VILTAKVVPVEISTFSPGRRLHTGRITPSVS